MAEIRFAQERGGQKLHIVPVVGDDVGHVAFCGRHTDHWRATFNLPMGYACKNCARVNRRRGRTRWLTLMRQALDRIARGERA